VVKVGVVLPLCVGVCCSVVVMFYLGFTMLPTKANDGTVRTVYFISVKGGGVAVISDCSSSQED
jgi:hypothetical protein